MADTESIGKKFFGRKWLLCLLWWGLLVGCVYVDGDFVKSGFCMVLAITGCIVTSVFVLGGYLKEIASIKYKDLEIKIKDKKNAKAK